jgi:putative drug exporter of the RND superfamily
VKSNLFYKFGKWIYRFRIVIILMWLVGVIACLPFLTHIVSPFQSTGFAAEGSESELTKQYLNKRIGYNSNRFLIIYHSKILLATDRIFQEKLKNSLDGLKRLSMKHEIIYPNMNAKQISKDKHTAYAVVLFKKDFQNNENALKEFKSAIKKPKDMSMHIGGESIFIDEINHQTQRDLYKADIFAAPASIITLILILGTVIAALVPLVLGGGCALLILATLFFLGHVFSLSIFTLNIALLLGLCLSLDYALFIIFRFREELQENTDISEAIAATLATAGRAVFFSGLAVFISLSALLFFPINILFSVGVGGLVAVFVAVLIAITLLPAVLAVLKHKINGIWKFRRDKKSSRSGSIWHYVASTVVNHRLIFLFLALGILCACAYPFMSARFGISDLHILPKHAQGYQFLDTYQQNFDEDELNPILLVVKSNDGKILSKNNVEKLFNLVKRIKKNPHVKHVNSIVNTSTELKADQYYALYSMPKQMRPPGVSQLLKTTTTSTSTVITVVSKYSNNSPETMKLVKQLRQMTPPKGLSLQLTGGPVNRADVIHVIKHIFPYMVLWIIILTYLILLVLFRSLFLPLKAIVVNILSLCASYGVLVYIFQEGHLHELLNFNPQGMLDISLLIIIFCALFGFSMDYEVFLLMRIKECYDSTHDNDKSIVFGIEKSSKIITSAALIVIILCGSFMSADVLMVKEFGLGIAVAIFVDAFIIRILLVPAIMGLMNKWNWYLPKWLDRVLPA